MIVLREGSTEVSMSPSVAAPDALVVVVVAATREEVVRIISSLPEEYETAGTTDPVPCADGWAAMTRLTVRP